MVKYKVKKMDNDVTGNKGDKVSIKKFLSYNDTDTNKSDCNNNLRLADASKTVKIDNVSYYTDSTSNSVGKETTCL